MIEKLAALIAIAATAGLAAPQIEELVSTAESVTQTVNARAIAQQEECAKLGFRYDLVIYTNGVIVTNIVK